MRIVHLAIGKGLKVCRYSSKVGKARLVAAINAVESLIYFDAALAAPEGCGCGGPMSVARIGEAGFVAVAGIDGSMV
jgi:hypothetical protein